MRITREILLNVARDTVKRQTFGGHDLLCVYLTGSLIYDQPMIGGITDIDLIYVHSVDIPCKREIIPVTDEIHLDIGHYPQSAFSQPRKLRTDVWVGSYLCHDPLMLYDTQHWFEYTLAGVFSKFFEPSNVIQRVKTFSERARSAWMQNQTEQVEFLAAAITNYLKILKDAANSIACLTSVPLTNRRFLLDLPERAQKLQMPGLVGGLIDLILPEDPIEPNWETWLDNWKNSYALLLNQPDVPVGLEKCRQPYYEKAILELSATQQEAALWLLLWNWALISSKLPPTCQENSAFNNFCASLSLDEQNLSRRYTALDTYLDTVEEVIDTWAYQNGL